jgi:ketosteroid isomerase-like protein
VTTAEDVLAMEERRWAAQIGEDLVALDELLADELRYTHSNTLVDNKTSYIQAIKDKKFDYRSVERTDTDVQVVGDTALVTGRADIHVVAGDRDLNLAARYSVVWVPKDGRLQLLVWQSTPVPA